MQKKIADKSKPRKASVGGEKRGAATERPPPPRTCV